MKLTRALIAAMSVWLSSCTALTAFNTLTPKDPALRLAQGQAYGQDARQTLDVYGPRGVRSGLPVVVFFYGGGWYEGRRQDYAFAAQAIATRGFIVVVPDYRVFPQVVYPAFLEDGAHAVRWTQDHIGPLGGDPARIVLAGHSAGAYNAVELALDDKFLKAAGVELRHIRGVAGLAGPYDFLPLDVKASRDAFGAYPDLPSTQPIHHVRSDAPPMFLAHGTADNVVGIHNTRNLAAALTAAGAPVEMHFYEGVDHAGLALALSRPFRRKAPLLADLTAFLRRATQ